MRICVLGLGYIGLPTAALFAANGFSVLGVEVNPSILVNLQQGAIHIEEAELEYLVKKAVHNSHLEFASHPQAADIFIITVPTPCTENKVCDLRYVIQAMNDILPFLKPGNMVILESTMPPCTCDSYIQPLLEEAGFQVGKDICLLHCPERVMPGKIMTELISNDRVIGGCNTRCAQAAADLYRQVIKGNIFITDIKTAEMTKLVENTFRDVNIALVNELALICNKLGLNVLEVIRLANNHPRVELLQPGPGVGGHCLAVDPYFIVEKAPQQARLIALAREINSNMPRYITQRVADMLSGIKAPRVAVFGVTYKGNTNDLRESPALKIIRLLLGQGFTVRVYDPHVMHYAVPGAHPDAAAAVGGADMILILSDHHEFKSLDYDTLAKEMRTPLIFDTKNIIKPADFSCSEISLYNMGGMLA